MRIQGTYRIVGESQQTTRRFKSLPASVLDATPSCNQVIVTDHEDEEKEDLREVQFTRLLEIKKVPEDSRSGHALSAAGGHLYQDNGKQPPQTGATSLSQLTGDSVDGSVMELLNVLENRGFCGETLTESIPCGQCASGDNNYSDTNVSAGDISSFRLVSEPTTTEEKQDLSSTRHSSGCDDSGVFLEDLPYVPENTSSSLVESNLEKFGIIQNPSPDMRPNQLDALTTLDSDAERSDDLGLASSSIDSADDLDGDPLPSTIEMQRPSPKKKTPPPVPPRKFVSSVSCDLKKNFEPIVLKQDEVGMPAINSVQSEDGDLNNKVVTAPVLHSRHAESFQWKSEECLRSAVGTKWTNRFDEKSVSVKDRIAMFSDMEAGPSKPDSRLHRFASETDIKLSPSAEKIEHNKSIATSKTDDFPTINRDTKWYSMYSLPLNMGEPLGNSETGNVTPPNSIPSLTSTSSIKRTTQTLNEPVGDVLNEESDPLCHEKPIVPRYPQTQLPLSKRYSYSQYSHSTIRTTEDLLPKRNSATSLLSILDTRKQPLAKLKGLVIPEKPLQNSSSKELPTILSSDVLVLSAKTDADIEKNWKKSMLSSASYKTMSLPRTRRERNAKFPSDDECDRRKLLEASWKSSKTTDIGVTPKYSADFKSIGLDSPNALTFSLSPTPPSSITSPLSPLPPSPSSICGSSATSVATTQQNIFQFSLSRSKRVTPILPEKPIMSPPSLPSDIEYEGDNSEDSSTSASPMASKSSPKDTVSSTSKSVPSFPAVLKSEKPIEPSCKLPNGFYEYVTTFRHATDSSELNRYESSPPECAIGETNTEKLETRASRQQNVCASSQNDLTKFSTCILNQMHKIDGNYSHNMTSTADMNDIPSVSKNCFLAASQDIQSAKFRAQPLVLKQSGRSRLTECRSLPHLLLDNSSSNGSGSNIYASEGNGINDSKGRASETNMSEAHRNYVSVFEYNFGKQQWPQSSEFTGFKKNKFDSEDDDDSHSSFSHRTEDSRPTTDEYYSDATSDSFDKSLDPDLKPRRLSQQRVVLKAAVDGTDSVQKFKALAEEWEHRADVVSPPPLPPPLPPFTPSSKKCQRTRSTSSACNSISCSIGTTCSKVYSPLSSPIKLPPSLMPRRKQPSDTKSTDAATNALSLSRRSSGASESKSRAPLKNRRIDSENTYETVWSDIRSRSSCTGSNELSDSGSNTDVDSTCSKFLKCQTDPDSAISHNSEPNDRTREAPSEDHQCVVNGTSDNCNRFFVSEENSSTKDIATACTSTLKNINLSSGSTSPKTKVGFSADGKFNTPVNSLECSPERSRKQWHTESEANYGISRTRSIRNDNSNIMRSRRLSKSQISLLDPLEYVRSHGSSYSKNVKSVSVSDIRKAFETQCSQNQNLEKKVAPLPHRPPISESSTLNANGSTRSSHNMTTVSTDRTSQSSVDRVLGDQSEMMSPARNGFAATPVTRDQIGSVTSLVSGTNFISSHDIKQLVQAANLALEDDVSLDSNSQQVIEVVVLQREVPAGSVGITLAGGADYEVKEITVHKVISGSLADRDGRIKKGDRVISINGKSLKGITHKEALDILKAPKPDVILVVSRSKPETNGHRDNGVGEEKGKLAINQRDHLKSKDFLKEAKKLDEKAVFKKEFTNNPTDSILVCVELQKDAMGLGFSLEGGRDSPLGDRPLLIKRIFKGGAADKDGQLNVGDEIVFVNGQATSNMTRTEAWNFLKKLPEETIIVKARKRAICS